MRETRYLVIDLSEPLREDTEVWPGDPKPVKRVLNDIREGGDQHHAYTVSDHAFHPHGDAPKHQNIELQDKGFEVFGLEYCFSLACLIDLADFPDAQEHDGIKYLVRITARHLKPFAETISQRAAVLIRTGYDRWVEANRAHLRDRIPYLTRDAADFLADFKNLRVIGTDSLTVDAHGEHYAHQRFKDRLIVEAMVHLYGIPADSRNRFDLQTTPVRIVGATGGPVVAYAFIGLRGDNGGEACSRRS